MVKSLGLSASALRISKGGIEREKDILVVWSELIVLQGHF